jgi:hypothetical protein
MTIEKLTLLGVMVGSHKSQAWHHPRSNRDLGKKKTWWHHSGPDRSGE